MRVLITRPGSEARPYMEFVRTHGGEPVAYPLYRYESVAGAVPDLSKIEALVFTSARGIGEFCARCDERALPVYVVGPQSAAAAREAGFETIHSAPEGAADLVSVITHRQLFYGRGAEIAFPLADALRARGCAVREAVLYKTVPEQTILPLPGIDLAAFFSARACALFADMVKNQGLGAALSETKALCLGPGMVEFLSFLPWKAVCVAPRPDRAGMMSLIEEQITGRTL